MQVGRKISVSDVEDPCVEVKVVLPWSLQHLQCLP